MDGGHLRNVSGQSFDYERQGLGPSFGAGEVPKGCEGKETALLDKQMGFLGLGDGIL